jgi:type 1 glutamine amidotransferase
MKIRSAIVILLLIICFPVFSVNPIRVLVITGGHDYNKEEFSSMLRSLEPEITCLIAELPAAYDMFLPQNRDKYDVLVFYHMWQTITPEQAKSLSECIRNGKPLIALHHSICAFDDWPEYWDIIGGKYFHKETSYKGKTYQPCSYIHDIHFNIKIASPDHPVTKGISEFPVFDETYKGYYVDESVMPLLITDEPSSTPVIGWVKTYGSSKIVVLQSGHDVATFQNPDFRKLLRQSIDWVTAE